MRWMLGAIALVGTYPANAQDAEPGMLQERQRENSGERDRSYTAYRNCILIATERLQEMHQEEHAETIVRAAEHSCAAEQAHFDLSMLLWASFADEDGHGLARDWRNSAHNAALASVLFARLPLADAEADADGMRAEAARTE